MQYLMLVNVCWLFLVGVHSAPSPKVGLLGDPIVTLPQGDVQGVDRTTPSGKTFTAFMGIPYGNAARFKAPTAAGAWTGTLDGTQEPPMCSQPSTTIPIVPLGIEDCLTLSVFTPRLTGQRQEVHVFIHGGAFIWGDIYSNKYGPERLIDSADVVIVLIQYRLGVFGFLSTGDVSAPGNFGLLDQNLALQWVQANIASFNGNPNQVTLTGESAGSVSVSSHLLSPKSAGLFNQAIMESGSALVPWGYVEDPLFYAQDMAGRFACDITTNAALVDCLSLVSADDLAIKQYDVIVANLYLAFVPTVDGDFIPDDPAVLFESGQFNQVPMIQGFNRDEGCVVYMFIPFLFQNIDDVFFNDTLPLLLKVLTDYRTNLEDISYAIKDEYYNIDLSNATAVTRASIDLISDMIIKVGSVQAIQFASQYVPVYMYEFNYVGEHSVSNFTGGSDVTHAIELQYMYNNTEDAPPLDAADSAFAATFVDLWSSFDTKGNPTPVGSSVNWPNTPKGGTTYFNIDTTFTVTDGYDAGRMNFWLVTVPQIAAGTL